MLARFLRIRSLRLVVALGIVALIVAGCLPSTPSKSTLRISITDAPSNDIKELWLYVTGVTVQQSNGSHIRLAEFDEPVAVELLSLRFDEKLLVEMQVEPGRYKDLRLELVSTNVNPHSVLNCETDEVHRVVYTNGDCDPVRVPPDKLMLKKFVVNGTEQSYFPVDGLVTELLVDVDTLKFARRQSDGVLQMNPAAARTVLVTNTGQIAGRIVYSDGRPIDPEDDVVVTLLKGAEEITSTLALRETTDVNGSYEVGEFLFKAIPSGTYSVKITSTIGSEMVIDDVQVKAGETTNLSELKLKIEHDEATPDAE